MEGLLENKAIKKKLSSIPPQQLEQLLRQFGGSDLLGGGEQKELNPRERLRRKIREAENQRLPRAVRQDMFQEEKRKAEAKQEEKVQQEETRKKGEKARLKRLRQRYGTVNEESYFQALTQLKDRPDLSNTNQEEYNRYRNLVDLYHHQHKDDNFKEKELDLDSETN